MDILKNANLITIACTCGALLFTGAILAVVFGGLGFFLNKRSKEAKAARDAAQSWPSTVGTVVLSRAEDSGDEDSSVSAHIVYKYVVAGHEYQYDQVRVGQKLLSITSSGDTHKQIAKYPVGAAVTVYYNPANPGEAALER